VLKALQLSAHAPIHVISKIENKKLLYIWNIRPQIAYSLYNFYGATITIKGC